SGAADAQVVALSKARAWLVAVMVLLLAAGAGGVAPAAVADRAPGAPVPAAPPDAQVDEALPRLPSGTGLVGPVFLLGGEGTTADSARATLAELRPGGLVHLANAPLAADAARLNAALPLVAREYGLLPLLIAVDHEGGRVQRVRDVPNLGSNGEFG